MIIYSLVFLFLVMTESYSQYQIKSGSTSIVDNVKIFRVFVDKYHKNCG